MKKSIVVLLMAFTAVSVFAQKQFEIANEFMSKKGIRLIDKDCSKKLDSNSSYSLFKGENGKGFAIVANGCVIGYSDESSCDENNIPDVIKSLIKAYSTPTTKHRSPQVNYPSWYTPKNVKPIPYMIKSKWHQGYPYNAMCPYEDRKQCIAGCVGVAFAQLMYYYRLPYETNYFFTMSCGNPKNEILPTTFDYDKMFDKYDEKIHTQENVDAVAKLVYYCAQVVNTSYHWNSACAAWADYIQPNLENIGLFDEIKWYHVGYDDNPSEEIDTILNVVDEYLEQGIPLVACGGGHCYIIDGRDSDGLYHINTGWGDGNWNGHFILKPSRYDDDWGVNYRYQKYFGFYAFTATREFVKTRSASMGVSIPQVDKTNGNVYNMQGKKVGNSLDVLPKGIYIKNGKKYIVK